MLIVGKSAAESTAPLSVKEPLTELIVVEPIVVSNCKSKPERGVSLSPWGRPSNTRLTGSLPVAVKEN